MLVQPRKEEVVQIGLHEQIHVRSRHLLQYCWPIGGLIVAALDSKGHGEPEVRATRMCNVFHRRDHFYWVLSSEEGRRIINSQSLVDAA